MGIFGQDRFLLYRYRRYGLRKEKMTMLGTSDMMNETLIGALLLVSILIICGVVFMSSKKNEDKTSGITLLAIGILVTVFLTMGAIVVDTIKEIDSCCTGIGRMG